MKIVFFCFFTLFTFHSDKPWQLIKDDGIVSVFSQKTVRGFDAVKIKATVKCSIEDFMIFVNDADQYTKWVYACSASKILEKNDKVLLYETITDMPYPFQDRYLKVESTHEFNGTSYRSHSIGIPAEVENMVVVSTFDSRWHVEKLEDNLISIDYKVETEPGGYIPAWLYNMAVDRGPYNTMLSLKRSLEENVNHQKLSNNEF